MQGFSQSDDLIGPDRPHDASAGADSAAGNVRGQSTLEEPELDAALQLLVERAQYITGATGTALALPQGEEMVCRASAGSCAPAVGARLQVRSGLTGESITRRQLLRCDNAEADPRVNLEACRALGIASIVVLPLLRRSGEVRGLFELFSDHPYAFEERDLIALERMADLTLTALDLTEQRHGAIPPLPQVNQPEQPAAPSPAETSKAHSATAGLASAGFASTSTAPTVPSTGVSASAEAISPRAANVETAASPTAPLPEVSREQKSGPISEHQFDFSSLHEAALHVQKCSSCGFPVSEGRTLCLDCENLEREKLEQTKRERLQERIENAEGETSPPETTAHKSDDNAPTNPPSSLPATPAVEEIPAFLANASMVKESWLADHVNLLAIVVLVLGILVAIVVFR